MAKHYLNGHWYTTNELAEMSGLLPHTLRDRIRRGYTVEQAIRPGLTHSSVEQFAEASHWEDWLNKSVDDVYNIYWQWCIGNGQRSLCKQTFSRQLMSLYPQIYTVPTKVGNKNMRIMRLRKG